MARTSQTSDNPETESEVSLDDAEFWLREIEAAKSRMGGWYDKAEEAEERYRDCTERPFGMLNIFWANVETQKAAIGEEFGKPQVTRVNQPRNDGGLARHIAEVWERTIAAGVRDTNDNHDIGLAVGDTFIPGRGQVWLELMVEETGEGNIRWASAPLVRVPYRDYLEGFATRWGDVPWTARRHLFTRDELISECGISDEVASQVPLNISLPDDDKGRRKRRGKDKEQFKRAAVWEIWTKFPEKARLYVAEDFRDQVLCADPDPFKLKAFFPCPRPLLANGDEGWQEPLTDYSRYEDQAKELDEISARIFVLTATLRRRGIHDKQFKELADLAEADDNVSLAVDNWVDLQAKGGLNKVCEWEDLTPIITVLAQLHQQRRELVQLIYELSGISDLARGQTDPDETLGAQQLKQTFGSSRFKRRETESRRFAAEAYQIKGELIAEHFPREQIAEMSGIPLPTEAEIARARQQLQQMMAQYQAAQQAGMQLPPPNQEQVKFLSDLANTQFSWERIARVLRSDYRRCYSVEVETDQTNFVDQEADKKARTEFFQAVMSVITQVMPMIAGNPKNGEVFKQLIMFVISAFKAGRSMEEGLERAIDEAIQMAGQQQGQQQQDPKAAADAQSAQLKLQTAQVGLQREQVKLQQIQASASNDAQGKVLDQQLAVQQAELKQQEAQNDAAAGQQKLVEGQQKIAQQNMANEAKRRGHLVDLQNKAEKLQFDRATRATATEALLKGPTQAPSRSKPAAPPA